MYQPLTHPEMGTYKLQNAPFKLSAAAVHNHSPGPMIGANNRAVMRDLLGIDAADFAQGYEDGTFWPQGMPILPYIELGQ